MKLSIRFLLLGSIILNTCALGMDWPLSFRTACCIYISKEIVLDLITEYIAEYKTKLAIIGYPPLLYSFADLDIHPSTSIETFKRYALVAIAEECKMPLGHCRIIEKRNGEEPDPTALFWDKHRTDSDCLIVQIKPPLSWKKNIADKPSRIPLPKPKLTVIHEEADPDDMPA